jgi:membrane-associated phospholipid phosphatase
LPADHQLRVDPAMLDVAQPSHWVVSVVYSLDPPYNLFPSFHLSITALAAFSAWKATKPCGAAVLVGVGLVGVATCTVKQHFLLDALGGLALASLACALILRPYHPQRGVTPAYTWRGPVKYLGHLALVYAGIYGAYLWAS